LEKNRLLLVPFSAGLVLLVCSWYLSYPLSIDSINDLLFNHVSILYWFSLPLLLTSMYMMCLSVKSNLLKWLLTLGIVLTLFSLSYFFYLLPGSDSTAFSGLTKYFIKTMILDPSQPHHSYFQWPFFFISTDVTTLVSGLNLSQVQFLQYALIGFLLTTTLFIYASKVWKKDGFIAVVTFFIVSFYFINYQDVPFSLALGLLFVLFMIETRPKSFGAIVTMLVLFTSLSLTHAFVPLFFVLYLLIRSIISRSKQYGLLFLLTLMIYLFIQTIMAASSFVTNLRSIMVSSTEYSSLVSGTLRPVSFTMFGEIAQMLSRTVVISFAIVCSVGFILLLVKRKTNDLDKGIFLMGVTYAGIGLVVLILGTRAIPLFLIPVSLGAAYLFQTKLRRYLKYVLLILLVLTVSIPLHATLSSPPALFQTKEETVTADFMIENHDWNASSTIFSDSGIKWYIEEQVNVSSSTFYDESSPQFQISNIENYDTIIYSVRLGQSLNVNASGLNLTDYNVIYNSGYSLIAEKAKSRGN
jgi:hypothetical protein